MNDIRWVRLISLLLILAMNTTCVSLCRPGESDIKEDGRVAKACQLANRSRSLLNGDPADLEASVLVAIEAMRTARLVETDLALRASLNLLARRISPAIHSAPVLVVAFSHKVHGENHVWLASGESDGVLQVFESETGSVLFRYKFQGSILAIGFSFDDRYLAVGTSNGIVQVFATEKKLCAATQSEQTFCGTARQGNAGRVNAVVFNPTGDRIAVASDDQYVMVFDSVNDRRPAIKVPQPGRVLGLSFSSNGHSLASAGDYGGMIFEDRNNTIMQRLEGAYHLNSISFSPDGELIATAGDDGISRVYDAHSRKELVHKKYDVRIQSATFSPDSKFVVVASADSSARVFSARRGDETTPLRHGGAVNAVAFSEDGNWAATASSDHTARVFDRRTEREIARLPLAGKVDVVCFGPGNRLAIASTSAQQLETYQISNHEEKLRLPVDSPVLAIDLSSDYELVALGSDDKTLRVFNMAGSLQWDFHDHDGSVSAVLFSPDDSLLATGDNGYARIFQAKTGKLLKWVAHDNLVQALAFNAKGKDMATGTFGVSDIAARMFNATEHLKDLFPPIPHALPINAIAFSPDDHLLATGGSDNLVHIFELPGGRDKDFWMPHDKAVLCLVFSKNSELIVSGSEDGNARIFDVKTGKLRSILHHDSAVVALAFTDDGSLLATATLSGIVRLFDPVNGTQIGQIDSNLRNIQSMKFSRDRRVIRIGALGPGFVSVRQYWVNSQDLMDEACSHLSRNLTKDEWKQYIQDESPHRTCSLLPDPK